MRDSVLDCTNSVRKQAETAPDENLYPGDTYQKTSLGISYPEAAYVALIRSKLEVHRLKLVAWSNCMSENTKTCFTISSCLSLFISAIGRMTSWKTATKSVFIPQSASMMRCTCSAKPRESSGPPTDTYVGLFEKVMKPPPKGGVVISETSRERPTAESIGEDWSLNLGLVMLPLTSQTAIEELRAPESLTF
jgi:hypothetical protein